MFKVTKEPTFTHTVKVMVPVDGGHEEQSFKTTYRVVDLEELTEIERNEGQGAVLKRIVTDMSDLVDDEKQPVPYSDPLRDQLIAQPYVRIAMYRTYIDGVTKAKSGN